jgi:hypothetical protein
MMTVIDDEDRIRELLAPLAGVEPARLTSRSRKRGLIAAALVAALLTAGGAALASGVNPFASITAANHARTGADVLDPATAAMIQSLNTRAGHDRFPTGRLLPDSARLVGQLSGGRRFYVITTSTNELCVMIEQDAGARGGAISCGNPLSQTQPTTQGTIRVGPQTPPLSFGIARDDVTSVSFRAKGTEQTVPVKNNVWFYEGTSSALASITVHYADGHTQTIDHTRR